MGFRRRQSASSVEPPAFNPLMGMLSLWDMSKEPANNFDVQERIGNAAKVRGVAIVGIDEDKGSTTYADGITHKRQKFSAAPFDPDAFVFRLFGTPTNRYGTWMPRLTLDMDENQSGENCRSTMLVDNAGDMSFAWLTDIAALVEAPSGGDLIGEGLSYDQAGFLESLYEKEYNAASYKRSALSMSIHRNKGFVDDGSLLGQLSHVFYLVRGGSGTVSAATGQGLGPLFSNLNGPAGGGGNNRARTAAELAIRGDAAIKFSNGVGRWNIELAPDAKEVLTDEARLVRFFLHLPGKKDDKFDTAEDGNCDYSKMDKSAGKQNIQAYVRVPKPGGGDGHRYDYSYHSPPTNGDGGSGTGSDTPTGGGATPNNTGDYQGDDESHAEEEDELTEGEKAAIRNDAAEENARKARAARYGALGD